MIRILILLGVMIAFTACKKETSPPPGEPGEPPFTDATIIRIPVVVHVLYNKDQFNISDQKIYSQVKVLNEDFRKANADHVKTPFEFSRLVADVGIEFFLADKDPAGKPTTGIIRKKTNVDGWDGRSVSTTEPPENFPLYFTHKGGQDAWPTQRYLNIYVVEISDRFGKLGLAGYAHFPGTDARMDAVVIDPRVFGTVPPLEAAHMLGRTATHEIGHWLNLKHIYGDETCGSDDEVADTPPAGTRYGGNPSYPQHSCGYSNMYMNYMDNVNDEAMYMFTVGQRARMRAQFISGGQRQGFVK